MNRFALLGLLVLGAGCDLPILMVEIEAPDVCVTRVVDVDPTSITGLSGIDELPSEMGVKLSGELGANIELEDNIVDLPDEAKDLLELDVQLKLVRITALPPHETALDQVNTLSFTVNPPASSGLQPRTILALVSDPAAPPGSPIEMSGDEINLAEYLYAGQLTFTYNIDAVIDVSEAWQAEVTTCIATRGYADASVNDIQDQL
jgi:hypothetical protein